jgi:hypothetical protein
MACDGPDAGHASRGLIPALRGQVLEFFDDGLSHFYNDGRYTYAYDMGDGGYAYGYFEVTEDSTVCIDFVNGFSRCDAFVENGRTPCPDHPRRRPVSHPAERDAGPIPCDGIAPRRPRLTARSATRRSARHRRAGPVAAALPGPPRVARTEDPVDGADVMAPRLQAAFATRAWSSRRAPAPGCRPRRQARLPAGWRNRRRSGRR